MGSLDPSHEDTLPLAATTGDTRTAAAPGIDLGHLPTGHERYVRGALLGRGGMGEVLLARDAQMGRDVALKQMRTRDDGATARFLREARIQGRLDHPAVVPVHEVAIDPDGRPFFVMKRLTGTTLAAILAPAGHDKHPLARLLRAFSDVCLAVEFAHTRGVIHRDLKPANIMLGDFGETYVLDWGVARVLGDDASDSLDPPTPAGAAGGTEAGAVLGTIGYMPPEQLRGLPVDQRADVYALGCILFEILAGAPLHAPGEYTAALDAYDARPSVRAPQREVPPELEALVVAATSAAPERRPRSARELADAVQRYLDGDRDIAQRRRIAREQIARARAALLTARDVSLTTSSLVREPPTEAQRRLVMQHAGRALALDPTASEAAELIGRIMLEPPRDTPPEVEAELDAADVHTLRTQARVATFAYLLYVLFIPLMRWIGATDGFYTGLLAIGAIVNAGFAHLIVRVGGRLPRWVYPVIVAANVGMLFLIARLFTPFLVAPGLATATMLAFSMHLRFGRTYVLAPALAAGVMLPWLGELLGWWPKSAEILDGALVLRSAGGRLLLPNVEIAHALYITALILVVGVLVRAMALTQRTSRRQLHLLAWHLRQLVPTPAP